MIDTDKKAHLSIEPYMELSFDEICELDEDVARQGVWNLREEVKRLREGIEKALVRKNNPTHWSNYSDMMDGLRELIE